MELIRLNAADFEELAPLQRKYKEEIGEEPPTDEELERLLLAIEKGEILFFGAKVDNRLIGCCSVCRTFSTFEYRKSGVFEDFFILPEYRHRGIARKLVKYAFDESGVSSLTVGCAECDTDMYSALGFDIPLGNMLAYNS